MPEQPEGAPSVDDPGGAGSDLARELLARARTGARAGGPAVRARPRRSRRTPDPRSGSGPDARDPQLIGPLVDDLVADQGWTSAVAVGGVEGRWDQVVGPDLAAHCRPDGCRDGVLTVRAESTAWATQVRLLAPTLVARLNADLGDGTVTRVAVVGPDAPSWSKGRYRVKGRGPRDTYG
ncbi:MAG: DciA family protein [Actinomycetota bacterium]|nr:DciA family protein [Actinomycetota bacterium]